MINCMHKSHDAVFFTRPTRALKR